MEVSLRTFAAALLLASAAVAENRVAVLPLEARAGALSAAEAAALTSELRAAVGEALAPHGFEVVAAEGTDARAALESTGAAAAVLGRAARMEGATVIGVGVYKRDSSGPASLVRVMGIGLPQLQADVRAKVPDLVLAGLGLAPAAAAQKLPRGTLKMPVAVNLPQPQPAPAAAAPMQPEPEQKMARAPRAPPPPGEEPLVTLIRETIADVEDLRGLRRKQNLKVQILDDKLFSAAVRDRAKKEMTPEVVAAERARWFAFNLAPAAADPAQVLLDVLDEQVAGFYDPYAKQLIVRKEPPASAAGALGTDGLRLVLAHEIEPRVGPSTIVYASPAQRAASSRTTSLSTQASSAIRVPSSPIRPEAITRVPWGARGGAIAMGRSPAKYASGCRTWWTEAGGFLNILSTSAKPPRWYASATNPNPAAYGRTSSSRSTGGACSSCGDFPLTRNNVWVSSARSIAAPLAIAALTGLFPRRAPYAVITAIASPS